jgi:hypothetical protein
MIHPFKRSILFILKAAIACTLLVIFFLIFYWYNNRLFRIEAKLILGNTEFDQELFKNGTAAQRASMAADLIKNGKYVGVRCDEITNQLGERTGDYYNSDVHQTYKLTEKDSANWILTFECGTDRTVNRVFIRKSCCSVTHEILYFGIKLTDPLIRSLLK